MASQLYKDLKCVNNNYGVLDHDNKLLYSFCRTLKNILEENIPLNDQEWENIGNLSVKQRETINSLAKDINKMSMKKRRLIIKQSGKGFLPVILPIAISALWSLLSAK